MNGNRRYYLLDAMRGIGAIAVMQFHATSISNIAQSGYLAVDFFFALSGFIIAFKYEARLQNGFGVKDFFLARVRRLYPLYALGMILGSVLFLYKMQTEGGNWLIEFPAYFIPNALMLPAPTWWQNFFPLNEPSWSLFFEMAINIAFALALFRWPTKILFAVVLLTAPLLVAACLYENNLGGWMWNTFHIGVLRVLFSFVCGVIVFRLFSARSPVTTWWSLLPLLALVVVLYVPHDEALGLALALPSIIVISPLILIAGVRTDVPRVLQPVAAFLGTISYPLYALHMPILRVYQFVAHKVGFEGPISMLVFTIAMIVIAYVLNLLVLRILAQPFVSRASSYAANIVLAPVARVRNG